MNPGNEYVLKAIRKFNRIENIADDLEFIKTEYEKKQADLIEKWLLGKIGDKTAKERIRAIRWFLQDLQRSQKTGKSIMAGLKDGSIPYPNVPRPTTVQ
jgi:hypothetical protein